MERRVSASAFIRFMSKVSAESHDAAGCHLMARRNLRLLWLVAPIAVVPLSLCSYSVLELLSATILFAVCFAICATLIGTILLLFLAVDRAIQWCTMSIGSFFQLAIRKGRDACTVITSHLSPETRLHGFRFNSCRFACGNQIHHYRESHQRHE
jgi:hypothetical protein